MRTRTAQKTTPAVAPPTPATRPAPRRAPPALAGVPTKMANQCVTVRQLEAFFATVKNKDAVVVLQADPEGNGHSPMALEGVYTEDARLQYHGTHFTLASDHMSEETTVIVLAPLTRM